MIDKRRVSIVTAIVAILVTIAAVVPGQTPPTSAPASAPGARTLKDIQDELQVVGGKLRDIISSPAVITDAAQRAAAAPKVLPLLRKMAALYREAAGVDPRFKEMLTGAENEMLSLMYLFGDAEAQTKLKTIAASADATVAIPAQTALLEADWTKAHSDAATQTKLLDQAENLVKANPENFDVASMLNSMLRGGPATSQVRDRLMQVMLDNLKGEQSGEIREQVQALQKMFSYVGKPVTIEGTTITGQKLSTASWKGKVVMIDFWATWCPPCLAELPEIVKVYDQYHAKGLEVLGVSNDQSADALKEMLSQNPDMKWPQLFDGTKDWHPMATEFGVALLPRLFLIDKKGVLRSAEGRDNMQTLVPQLLAEKSD
jgi:thiol-disulfide isomerase/thioredoxin